MMTPEGIRGLFPALASPTVFMDNAGGSQLPRCVIEAVTRYLRESYVQLNADYDESRRATATVARARDVVRRFVNGDGIGEVLFGSSTTVLCYQLAAAYADASRGGKRDQIIVCTAGHEANVGPWMRLASRGFEIVPWHAEPAVVNEREINFRPSLETLKRLLSERTRLVLFPQVSNILGEVWDVRAVADLAHSVGARVLVDGVAYAPHRAPDVAQFGCDWYVYSTYKVFGPHMAAMFGTHEALAELTGPNHEFITGGPYKWELGGPNHEGCAGVAALWDFVCEVNGVAAGEIQPDGVGSGMPRHVFERAFGEFQRIEERLQERLIGYLRGKRGVRIVGPARGDSTRVATVSFLSDRTSPREISRILGERGIGIRWGHAYSKRLCDGMGLGGGVARVSLVAYNTDRELDRLFEALDAVV